MSKYASRTNSVLPLRDSWAKNSPRPFLNDPTSAGSSVPVLLLAQ